MKHSDNKVVVEAHDGHGLNTRAELIWVANYVWEWTALLIIITTCRLIGRLYHWRPCFWTAALIDQAGQHRKVPQVALSEADEWLPHHRTQQVCRKRVDEEARKLGGCMTSHDITAGSGSVRSQSEQKGKVRGINTKAALGLREQISFIF